MKFCPEGARFWGEPRGKYLSVFFCYILECSDRSFYIGVTDDPARRLEEHNQGKGGNWTAGRRPVKLVWTERHASLSSVRIRENQLMRWSYPKKEALIGGSPRPRSGQAPGEYA